MRAAFPGWGDEELFQLSNAPLLAKIRTMELTPAVISHLTTVRGLRANWFGLARGARPPRVRPRVRQGGGQRDPGLAHPHYGVPYSRTDEFVVVYRMHPLIADDWSFRSTRDDRLLQERTFREIAGPGGADLVERVAMADLLYSFGTQRPVWCRCTATRASCRSSSRPTAASWTSPRRTSCGPVSSGCRGTASQAQASPAAACDVRGADRRSRVGRAAAARHGDVESVDLVVGMYGEPKAKGFGFSDTAFRPSS